MNETASCVARESEVIIEVNKLGKEVENCLQLCSSLEAKLSPVLRPMPPTAENQNKKSSPIQTPLAAKLFNETDKLDSVIRFLDSILNRIEV